MTNNEAARWIQLYIDLAKFDPSTGEEAYLNEDDRKTLEAMEIARDALICMDDKKMHDTDDLISRQSKRTNERTETRACDCISRQAAIDEVVAWMKDRMSDKKNGKPLTERLRDLPSAQQDCTECAEYDQTTKSCPKYCDVIQRTLWEAKQERTGRWELIDDTEFRIPGYRCSVCHCECEDWDKKPTYRFCPNCGARMEGES